MSTENLHVLEHQSPYGFTISPRDAYEELSKSLPVNAYALFTVLVRMANFKQGTWFDGQKTITIERGELVSSHEKIMAQIRLSRQNLRTALAQLLRAGRIKPLKSNQQPNQRYTFISIVDFDTYSPRSFNSNQPSNQQVTSDQPAGNQRLTTIEESKKEKKEKNNSYKNGNGLARFDEFYLPYPKHVQRGDAENAWRRLDDATKELAIAAIPKYKPKPEFILNPATWLNRKCWLDEQPELQTWCEHGIDFRLPCAICRRRIT